MNFHLSLTNTPQRIESKQLKHVSERSCRENGLKVSSGREMRCTDLGSFSFLTKLIVMHKIDYIYVRFVDGIQYF